MKKFRELSEAVKDKFDIGEYDQEGDMAKSDLRSILANAKRVHDMLEDDDNLPEWVQSKITKAEDYMSTVANYMEAEMNEEVELDEAIPKSTHYATLHSSSRKIVAKGNKKDMLKKMKELNKKEKGSHHLGVTHKGKVGDIFGEEVELDEGISKVYHNFMAKRAGAKADHAYDMDDEKEFQKQVDKTEYHRVKAGGRPTRINTNPNAKMLTTRALRNEEVELDEGRPSQRHPLEGHEYHKKSNDALVHIAKDAHKAAEAMKGHNTNAENKYRDQANDSATVRHFRKTSGMPDWYKKKYGHMKEEIETLEEKNKPTNPELWSRAIALAKSKFDVYPSAYANGWASKWYKSKGGGWRTVSEAKEDNMPFKPDEPNKKSVVVGKKPEGYSIARQLARQAMQKQIEKLKKPVKEETHKAKIVKDIMKKKKDSSENAFQNEPELSSTLTKGF